MLWTGILGGLASSTATTLALSRYARLNPAVSGVAVSGALAACGVMFLRMAVLVALVQPALLAAMGVPLILSGVTLLVLGLWHWRRLSQASGDQAIEPMVPTFDLGAALGFGAYLAVMAVLAPAARQWLGSGGVYALASLSGLADVDAIVISLARLHGDGGLPLVTTIAAICLATLANMVSKGAMAWITGGKAMGGPVVKGYAVGMAVGVGAAAAMLALGA
jgi:uncharacterized membrane protein (DUF4010 family)